MTWDYTSSVPSISRCKGLTLNVSRLNLINSLSSGIHHHRYSLQVGDLCWSRNMAANVGLSTPRGSGTSGYVQRNLSHLKPRDNVAPYPKDQELQKHRQRKPDKDILNHDRLREIEVKVFDLRDKLEDEG